MVCQELGDAQGLGDRLVSVGDGAQGKNKKIIERICGNLGEVRKWLLA